MPRGNLVSALCFDDSDLVKMGSRDFSMGIDVFRGVIVD
jgi:hypothetical protein